MGFNFDTRGLERAMAEAARKLAKDNIMEAARRAKMSMGSRGSSLKFEYKPSSSSSLEKLGDLKITGADDGICKEAHELIMKSFK